MRNSRRLVMTVVALAVAWSAAACAPALAQVVALGASNTAGYGVYYGEAFPAQLEAMLRAHGYSVSVANAGVPGDGTRQMLDRFDSAIPAGTRVVLLDVGGGLWNNARRWVSGGQGAADFAVMRAKLNARHIRVIEVHTNANMPPQYIQADRKHLTPEGHRLLAARLLPQVERALGSPR